MASILDVSVSSDSENDADFIPPGDVALSESSGGEENSDEDELEAPKRGKTKKSVKKEEEYKETEESNVKDPKDVKVDEKKHADDIWKSFLNDVEATSSTKSSTVTSTDMAEIVRSIGNTPVKSSSIASKELTANVFEFAGETFTVDNAFPTVSGLENTKVAVSATTSAEVKGTGCLPQKRGGIESVLGTLSSKKQKMTTLQKSLYDWKSFKASEGIEEDLEKFNKGRGGFIERQRFLQRSDVRSFEAEKEIRQSRKKK